MSTLAEIPPRSRATLVRAAAATWLLLISIAVIINHVALTRLSEQAEGSVQVSQMTALQSRMAELGQQIDHDREQPAAVTQAGYDADRQGLEQRLASIEQAVGDRLPADGLVPLEQRLDQLVARLDQLQSRQAKAKPDAPAPARARATPAPKAKAPEPPPFTVLGVEMRGGERFVSILPVDKAAFSEARLLHPGESEDGWLLESVEAGLAVFRQGTEVHRLAVERGR
ncbi:hypothetical protein [Achromobacter pestifer]|uniref:Uncharacterized protein n=1 Tax=Achromobacter pestifer TaxID=1353889 RepID=A0A6S7A003_9BURK|nr:hypothetical protein [Achromobacter pestifer]CAB3647923.1 hypothetical protein LMG3431_02612 [Achromobacter pestifer]